MRHADRLLGIALATAVLTATVPASAFCRTTTERPPADVADCWTQGLPIYQPAQCLPYRLWSKESPKIPNAILSDRLARAFAAWTAPNPTCVPGITAIELSPVNDPAIVAYSADQPGRNVIGVAPTWTHVGSETLSLTTLTFRPGTGEVIDSDVEINGEVSWSFTEAAPSQDNGEVYDLQTALTHEVGHMLGLAHSADPDSSMYPSYDPISIEIRTLNADDQAGVCAIYPNRGQRITASGPIASTACELIPGDVNSPCTTDITHGCSAAPARGGVSLSLGAATMLLVLLLRARRPANASLAFAPDGAKDFRRAIDTQRCASAHAKLEG